MIKIIDKKNCCGCSACASICPKHCISMQSDNEGFLYPVVNEEDCIDCGLCEKVCHELHPLVKREPIQVHAAINKNEEVRLKSSSGGIFYMLAQRTIAEGGVVFGARFDNQWQVVIDYADDLIGIKSFVGSKYVQARVDTAYVDAKHFLTEGRKVLFSGTPCQIAGLNHFLCKHYDNLLTVDIICHGTPSPKVWSRYLDEVVVAGRNAINDIQFRNKRSGWKSYNFSINYNPEHQTISLCSPHNENHYMKAFLQDMILRPSCYNCQAKNGSSHSDITLADFWGINIEMPEMDDNKGTSLVLVNTEKGRDAIAWSNINYHKTSLQQAIRHNPAYLKSVSPHHNRSKFFEHLDDSESVVKLIIDCIKPTLKQRFKLTLSACKRRLKRTFHSTMGEAILRTADPYIPYISNTEISAVNFRDKKRGWFSYRMEIIIKANQE